MKNNTKPAPVYSPFAIRSVLSNRKKNAFSVVWMDGTTTVVHCQPGDKWDDEKALAMCFTKKALGNKGNFNDKFNDALDNKMKVIPEEKKVIPAKEVCNCDGKRDHGIHSCTECKCKEESEVDKSIAKEFVKASLENTNAFGVSEQTATELAKAANIANSSLKEMINALTNETKPLKKKEKTYTVYLSQPSSTLDLTILAEDLTLDGIRHFVKQYAKKRSLGYYYRTWNSHNGMHIDFGSSEILYIEGLTTSEYLEK